MLPYICSPEATQISSTAWGKYVSAFWAEQDDRVARAEARLKWLGDVPNERLGRMEGVLICSPGGLPMPGCGPYSRQARLLPHFLDPRPNTQNHENHINYTEVEVDVLKCAQLFGIEAFLDVPENCGYPMMPS